MLRRLWTIPLVALLLSACGSDDPARRADAETIRVDLSRLHGVVAAGVEYTSSFENGQVVHADLTFRPDVGESDMLAAALAYEAARARSSLAGVFSNLSLSVPRAGGSMGLSVVGTDPPAAASLGAEIHRWYALAAIGGARPSVRVQPPMTTDVGLTLPDGDVAAAYRRVAATPGIELPTADWTIGAPSAAGADPNLILRSTGGLPGPEVLDAWDGQLAAVRPVLGAAGGVTVTDLPDVLVLVTRLPDVSSDGDPERSPAWAAVTGQIRALHATHRSFTYQLELPYVRAEVRSDECGPGDSPWSTAIARYYRSLPGSRTPAC